MSVYRPSLRGLLAVAAAGAAVVLVGACEADQVGTAASAGGARLSVSDLQDQVTDVVERRNDAIETQELDLEPLDLSGDLSEVQQQQLTRWITRQVYEGAAEDLQIEVTEAQIDTFLDNFSQQLPEGNLAPFLAEQGYTQESLREEARVALISEQLTQEAGGEAQAQEALQSTIERLDIEVSPRYGSWDEQGFVPGSGSVSEPFEDDVAAAGGPAQQ